MNLKAKIENIFPKEADVPTAILPGETERQDKYLINGKIKSWKKSRYEVFSPIFVDNGNGPEQLRLGSYPLMTATEAMHALDAACQAYGRGNGNWPKSSLEERISTVEKFIRLAKKEREKVVNLLMWETGKSHTESYMEFDRTFTYTEETIEAVRRIDKSSQSVARSEVFIGRIKSSPAGVVLCMGPSNYPIYETYTLVLPALLMGNTVVLKIPRLGALLHYYFFEAMKESFPPGVINTIYGEPESVLMPAMSSGKIDVLAYMGNSTFIDPVISRHSKPHRLKSILGLEAKNPAIILPDCDLDLTVKESLLGALAFNGQRCAALKMLFIHRDIAGKFLKKLVEALESTNMGMPWDEGVRLTPISDPERISFLKELLSDATEKGARILNPEGGTVNRSFFYPALVGEIDNTMRLYEEEQFGPIIPYIIFDDPQQPVEYIINSNYGQQLSIFGNDSNVIRELVSELQNQVARININCKCQRGPEAFPFTGKKDSGKWILSIEDTLEAFSSKSLFAAKDNDKNSELLDRLLKS